MEIVFFADLPEIRIERLTNVAIGKELLHVVLFWDQCEDESS